jgi:AraC-type DNA-binding domain-containing proteins
MNIMYEQVDLPGGSPLKVKWDDFPHFTFPWHYHSEYEILYVIKSYGTRYVGDHMGNFSEGSLMLVGSNVPHLWKNAPEFYSCNPKLRVNAVVIQFPEDFVQGLRESYPEFQNIRELLLRSERGISFEGDESKLLGSNLLNLLDLNGLDRVLSFLKILEQMALAKNYKLLASEAYKTRVAPGTEERLAKILNYIQLNYQNEILVDDLAKKFNMNTSALCRYFKSKTSKPIMQYVNEMRVGYACKLLMDKKLTVSEICYASGFNNIVNFNRIFKRINGCSPTVYRVKIKG